MSKFKREQFCIDSVPNGKFNGYTNGETWNGFACPYFERDEAERILRASEANGYVWSYSTDQDAFTVRSSADPVEYEPEVFKATTIVRTDGTSRTVYAVGAFSWTWETCQ